MPDTGLSEAINRIPDINLKRTILSWLYKDGPFWEDKQEHHSNDWLECKDETIVTDSSVGEAASRILHGRDCGLISIAPSNWTYSPVHVTFRTTEPENSALLSIKNWWIPHELENDLIKTRPDHRSWHELAESCQSSSDSLIFFKDSFDALFNVPFSKPVSSNIEKLLNVLDSLVRAHDSKGNRTNKGHQIYRDFFTGARSKFSDSSDTEKHKFRKELTFSDRQLGIHGLSCPWHGKVNYTTPIRIHFSWPIQSGQNLYVVYIGPDSPCDIVFEYISEWYSFNFFAFIMTLLLLFPWIGIHFRMASVFNASPTKKWNNQFYHSYLRIYPVHKIDPF